MPNFANANITGRPGPSGSARYVVADKRDVPVTVNPAANDTIELAVLPARHVPIDLYLQVPDLDAGGTPTITLALGLLNASKTDLSTAAADGGAFMASGLTEARTGGLVSAATSGVFNIMAQVQPSDVDRILAVKVTAAAATFQSGTFRVVLMTTPA